MIPRFKLPAGSSAFRGTRKQIPSVVANASSDSFSEEELQELRDDISRTMAIRGTEDAVQIVPEGKLRERIRNIGNKPSREQRISAGVGAVGGGLLGAGAGALTMGLARGRRDAPVGLLAGVPGAIAGHGVGSGRVKKRRVLEALNEELGPGAGVKRANVEPGFKEVLRHLHGLKAQNALTMPEFAQSIRDLKDARGRGLLPPERLLVRKVVLGQKDPPKPAKLPKLAGVHKPKSFSRGKAVGIAAGAAAALALLGLGVAHWPRGKDDSFRD